tara:strand:+ start:667 stop:885 length:219 start_codon:yes stop_codon:yes gene_type:complete
MPNVSVEENTEEIWKHRSTQKRLHKVARPGKDLAARVLLDKFKFNSFDMSHLRRLAMELAAESGTTVQRDIN